MMVRLDESVGWIKLVGTIGLIPGDGSWLGGEFFRSLYLPDDQIKLHASSTT